MLHFSYSCVFVVVVVVCCATSGRQLPDDVPTCSRSDPELVRCLHRLVRGIRPYLAAGIESIQIPPHEPFRLSKIEISVPFATLDAFFNVTIRDFLVYGFSDFVADDIEIVSNTPRNTTGKIKMTIPMTRVVMKFEARGAVKGVGVSMKGRSTTNVVNMKANITSTITEVEENGRVYFEIVYVQSNLRVGDLKTTIVSTNPLYDYVGAVLSQIINENFNEILETVYPSIQRNHENVIKQIVGRVLHNIDARDIIIP